MENVKKTFLENSITTAADYFRRNTFAERYGRSNDWISESWTLKSLKSINYYDEFICKV